MQVGITQVGITQVGITQVVTQICITQVGVHMNVVPRSTKSTEKKGTEKVGDRPRSSVGRVTVDLIQRSWVRFPPRSKDFFFTSCGSRLIPFTRANAQLVIHGFK